MDNLSTNKEPMTCIIYATPNAPNSYTMQETWVECSNQCQYAKGKTRGWLGLTFLHHVLLLRAQSQQS